MKVSPEESQILSCDTVVANERYICCKSPRNDSNNNKHNLRFFQHLLDNERTVRGIENTKDIVHVTNGVNRMDTVDKT